MVLLEVIPGGLISVLVLLGVLVIWIILYLKYSYFPFQVFAKAGIKCPPPHFFLGNYLLMAKFDYMGFVEYLHKKYGPNVGFYAGLRPVLSVTDIELTKRVLVKDFENFINRPQAPDFFGRKPDETKGMALDRDEMWRVGRLTLSPTFSSSKIRAVMPLVERSVNTLAEIFGEHDAEKSFELMKLYSSCTMEIIFATAFGRVMDMQRKSNPLVEASFTIFNSSEGSFDETILFIFLYAFPWLEHVLHFLMRNSKIVKSYGILKNTALQLIKERRAVADPGKFRDFLQLMIDATVEGEENKQSGNSKRKLTDEEITAHAILFMSAGYDTTATSLSYTSYLLAIHPQIQQKVHEEIDNYYQENPDASLFQAAVDMVYLEMVYSEANRVYSGAVTIDRECKSDYKYKDITIPKGTVISIALSILHKDPQYWKDPEKFDPMRFTPEEKAKRPQECYMPFGFGQRNCIGMRFAILEAKMILIGLLKEFTFVRGPDTEVPLKLVMGNSDLLMPKNGIHLKVVKRN